MCQLIGTVFPIDLSPALTAFQIAEICDCSQFLRSFFRHSHRQLDWESTWKLSVMRSVSEIRESRLNHILLFIGFSRLIYFYWLSITLPISVCATRCVQCGASWSIGRCLVHRLFASVHLMKTTNKWHFLTIGNHIIVSAPTGSGKTIVLELAIVELLTYLAKISYHVDEETTNLKIIYGKQCSLNTPIGWHTVVNLSVRLPFRQWRQRELCAKRYFRIGNEN